MRVARPVLGALAVALLIVHGVSLIGALTVGDRAVVAVNVVVIAVATPIAWWAFVRRRWSKGPR